MSRQERQVRELVVEVMGCAAVLLVGVFVVCCTAVLVRAALAVWGLAQ
jgi:hypothetical protein